MEGETFINNMYSSEMDKPFSEDSTVYMDIESCDPGNSGIIGKQSNEVGTRHDGVGIKRSSFYIVSALIFVATVFSGIINLVHLIKSDCFNIPEGYVLLPRQYLNKGKDIVHTNPLSQNVTPTLQSTDVTTNMEMKNSTIPYVINQASTLTNATTQELKTSTTFSTDLTPKSTVTTTQASSNLTTAYATIATISSDFTLKKLEKSTTSFVSSTNKFTDGITHEMKTSKTSPITSAFESTNATTSLDTKSSKTFSKNILETTTNSMLPGTTEQIRTESKGCPAGWLIYGSSCYFLSIQQATWSEAFVDCTSFGGYLVEINDAAEDQFLIEQVKRAKESFWIGLTDRDEENKWIWMTSRTVVTSNSYTNWGPGQPNNCCTHGEDCVTIASHRSYLWNDEPCEGRNKYFCEKELE